MPELPEVETVRRGLQPTMEGAAIAGKDRMDRMRAFFEGVGAGDSAGVWEGEPNIRADFRAINPKKLEKQRRAAAAREMI